MKVGIVGLGYVGLPLAVAFAEAGATWSASTWTRARVERLQRGGATSRTSPRSACAALAERFAATTDDAAARRLRRAS